MRLGPSNVPLALLLFATAGLAAPQPPATAPSEPNAPKAPVPGAGGPPPSGIAPTAPAPQEPAPAEPAPELPSTVEPPAATDHTAKAPAPRPVPPMTEPREEEWIAPARDTIGRHLTVGAEAGAIFPFGSVAAGIPQSDLVGPGFWLSGDILYGLNRYVSVGAYGEVGMPSSHESGSSFTTIAAGPDVQYHLVQGVHFDPWISAGIGFRRTSNGNDAHTGMDWLRAQIGGDWYPIRNLGIGPVLEIAFGTFFGESTGASVNAHFVAGGRIVFDSPGK